MADRDLVAAAWRAASEDLGILVEIGRAFSDADGRTYEYVAFIPDFGRPNGAVVLVAGDDSTEAMRRLADERQVFSSELHDLYESYDRDLFIETLDDWQWHGVGDPPAWYTGTPWTP